MGNRPRAELRGTAGEGEAGDGQSEGGFADHGQVSLKRRGCSGGRRRGALSGPAQPPPPGRGGTQCKSSPCLSPSSPGVGGWAGAGEEGRGDEGLGRGGPLRQRAGITSAVP